MEAICRVGKRVDQEIAANSDDIEDEVADLIEEDMQAAIVQANRIVDSETTEVIVVIFIMNNLFRL